MRYWFDTEFHDDGTTIELISIGMVSEDNRAYYAESADYDRQRATPWIREHVLPYLGGNCLQTRREIRAGIQTFIDPPLRFGGTSTTPEFWAFCGEYDWIVLRQLFGDLMAWPHAWPIFAMDIAQWRVHLGSPELPRQIDTQHHALADARHVRACWLALEEVRRANP